jgi:hypothetical protein
MTPHICHPRESGDLSKHLNVVAGGDLIPTG